MINYVIVKKTPYFTKNEELIKSFIKSRIEQSI